MYCSNNAEFSISLLTFLWNHGIVLELMQKTVVFCTRTTYAVVLLQKSFEQTERSWLIALVFSANQPDAILCNHNLLL
jgi:hypothetical protein